MIKIQCSACSRAWEVSDFLSGMTVVCKSCGGRVDIPRDSAKPPPPSTNTPAQQTVDVKPPSKSAVDVPRTPKVENVVAKKTLPAKEVDELVKASLDFGQTVPEIEQRLIARGLSAKAAKIAVMEVIEDRVYEQSASLKSGKEKQRLHVIASAVVGCVCVALGFLYGGGWSAGKTLGWIALPLACIWFPANQTESPAAIIRWCGWGLLLLIAVYRAVLLTT